uniref:Uncharacterized protein n=1 Tax=Physcomitrium patens TaxID=3218 RepID=A9TZG1_PHYPA|nr:hypothetical protein PHYPA_016860 [Physcomitrium patens]
MALFKVNDVQPDLAQLNYWMSCALKIDEQAKFLAERKRIEAFSHPGKIFVDGYYLKSRNPLLASVYLAFRDHLPLILTPDAIWNTIMLGVSEHVSKDPEKHRHAFVSHKGKETLKVYRDEFRRGALDNDWGGVVAEFADKIAEKLSGSAALTALHTRFTTIDEIARVAHAIVFMDAVKGYFEFKMSTRCGIPSIELTGTKEDWQKLRAALVLLDDLDLSDWRAQLNTVLLNFEDAFDDKVDKSFWNDIFLEHGAMMSGGVTTVSGWIGTLFLYTKNGLNSGALGMPSGARDNSSRLPHASRKWRSRVDGGLSPRPINQASESRYRQAIDPAHFPSGLSETPFKWIYFDEKIDMLLRGGLVGVVVNQETHAVCAQLGWLITDAKAPEGDLDLEVLLQNLSSDFSK